MRLLRQFRFFAFALIVALIQAGVPVLAYARMAQDHGLTQEVCSPQGVKKVVVDASGVAHEVAAGDSHDDHCQLCVSAGPTPIATLISFHESVRSPALIRVGQTCHPSGSAASPPPATGPPSGT